MNKNSFLSSIALAAGILASAVSLQASTRTVTGNIQTIDGKSSIRGSVETNTALHHTPGAHVHVQLIDSNGVLLEEVIQRLPASSPRAEAGRNYRTVYSVTSQTKNISKVRSFFVDHPHAECPHQKS